MWIYLFYTFFIIPLHKFVNTLQPIILVWLFSEPNINFKFSHPIIYEEFKWGTRKISYHVFISIASDSILPKELDIFYY